MKLVPPVRDGFSPLQIGGVPDDFNELQQNAIGGHCISKARLSNDRIAQKPGYYYGVVFSFDNLNKMVMPNEYCSRSKVQIMNMTSAYVSFNRVPLEATEAVSKEPRKKCAELPLTTWHVTSKDVQVVREDHLRRVKYHLVNLHPVFASLRKKFKGSDSHKYSKEMTQPSNYISLGIFNEDENTTQGMLAIIKRLEQYCPAISRDRNAPIVAFGDGLTTDRLRKAQESCMNAVSEENRHLDIFPGNSSWHKQVRLLQDDMDILMPQTTACGSPGTLAHFRSRFCHTQAGSKVDACFNETFALLKFTMQSYILAKAQELLGVSQIAIDKTDVELIRQMMKPTEVDWLEKLLDSVSRDVVEFEWKNLDRSFQTEKIYCICRRPWTEDDPDNADYVGCDNSECTGFEWYHRNCLKMQKRGQRKYKLPPKGEKAYFCCVSCDIPDKALEYSKVVINAGLNHDCFCSSIRSGDGNRMQIYHKLHMVRLFNHNHTLYFRIYHYILGLMVNGPSIVKHDLLYNSTINFRGTEDGNLSLDYVNELLNKWIKESMSISKGNLTDATKDRRTQCMQYMDELRKEMEIGLDIKQHSSRSKRYEKTKGDIPEAVKIILGNNLLHTVRNRSHSGFEAFTYQKAYVNNICAFEKALSLLSSRVDTGFTISNEKRVVPKTVEEEFIISKPQKK